MRRPVSIENRREKKITVEPLYNGHPWDWAKLTLIAG